MVWDEYEEDDVVGDVERELDLVSHVQVLSKMASGSSIF